MKDPNISITRSNLIKVMVDLGLDESFADLVFKEARKYPCNRYHIAVTKAKKKQLEKVIENSFAKTFEEALAFVRAEKLHKGIRAINVGSVQYATLCSVSKDCERFIGEYGLEQHAGLFFYINYGIELMARKYSLNKFSYYSDRIYQKYEEEHVIKGDKHPEVTAKLFAYYNTFRTVDMCADFVYAAEEIGTHNVKSWVDAQKKGLEFTGNFPTPRQLHGNNAKLRFQNYGKQNTNWFKAFKQPIK